MRFCFCQPMRYCFCQNSSGRNQWCSVPFRLFIRSRWDLLCARNCSNATNNEIVFPLGLYWCRPMRFSFHWDCSGAVKWDSLQLVLFCMVPTNEILFPLCLFGADQWDSLSVGTVLAPNNKILFLLGLFWCRLDSLSVGTVLAPTKEILCPLGLSWCCQWDYLSVRTVLVPTIEILFCVRTVLVPSNEILFPLVLLGLFWCRPMRFFFR